SAAGTRVRTGSSESPAAAARMPSYVSSQQHRSCNPWCAPRVESAATRVKSHVTPRTSNDAVVDVANRVLRLPFQILYGIHSPIGMSTQPGWRDFEEEDRDSDDARRTAACGK